jgi:phosphotriesterase-related protein
MGFTLMHEHILVGAAGVYADYPEFFGPDPMERVVEALKTARAGGVDTIVDATTLDLGRDIRLLYEASRKTGVNIIACTGWWLEIPRFFTGLSADQLAEVFLREIEQGISGTDIKAGILKAAHDIDGVTPMGEIMLRAVARAHRRSGLPIMLHSYSPGRVGLQQLAILKDEGVALNRVKMDHSNDTMDVEYLIALMEEGCYLGLDRYPGMNVSPLSRTRTMKALIDAGYADRLCPSHDGIILRILAANPVMTEEERLLKNPYGYLFIKNVVFPQLRAMGVSEEVIDGLCIKGPKKFFEG